MYNPSVVPAIWNSAYNASSKSIDTNFKKKAMLVMKPVTKNSNNKMVNAMFAIFFQIDDAPSEITHNHINARRVDSKGFISIK